MPTSLTFEEHLDALVAAGTRMASLAEESGLDARVPTCPTWTVRSLLAHQSMVHRWAAAVVSGGDPESIPPQTRIVAEVADLVGYFRAGLDTIVDALRQAPDDLEAMVFLNDAPSPRHFWARRQAHETTVHMADALSAVSGALPTATDVGVGTALAADGIDELLCGFITRGRAKVFDGTAYDVLVAPSDSERRWSVHVDASLTTDPSPGPDASAAVTVTGTAAAVYLGLWNRGDEMQASGDDGFLSLWRAKQRVRWS